MGLLAGETSAQSCYSHKYQKLSRSPNTLQDLKDQVRVNRTWIDDCNQLPGGGTDFYNHAKKNLVSEAMTIVYSNPSLWSIGGNFSTHTSDLIPPPEKNLWDEMTEAAGPLQNSFYSPWLGTPLGGAIGVLLGLAIPGYTKIYRAFVVITCGMGVALLGSIFAVSMQETYSYSGYQKSSLKNQKAFSGDLP